MAVPETQLTTEARTRTLLLPRPPWHLHHLYSSSLVHLALSAAARLFLALRIAPVKVCARQEEEGEEMPFVDSARMKLPHYFHQLCALYLPLSAPFSNEMITIIEHLVRNGARLARARAAFAAFFATALLFACYKLFVWRNYLPFISIQRQPRRELVRLVRRTFGRCCGCRCRWR